MQQETIISKFLEIKKANPQKKAITFKGKKKWKNIRYTNLERIIKNVASNLNYFTKGKKISISILSENRWEWLVSDLATLSDNHILVPLHTTNSIEINNYILKHCESKILFVSEKMYKETGINELLAGTKIKLLIIYRDSKESLPVVSKDIKIISFDSLYKETRTSSYKIKITKGSDIAYILYTSGTTGDPKGVMLTHFNLLSNINQIQKTIPIYKSDTFLSFLPYSHALEHTAGFLIPLLNGARICLAESVDKLGDNLKERKPTVMVVVPRIFEKVYEKIIANVNASNTLKQKLFYWSLSTKPEDKSLARTIADRLVFKKIRDNVGGNIRFFVSGGSSLSQEIAEFFYKSKLLVTEGYGLSETSPIISVSKLDNIKFGTVGQPLPDTDIKVSSDKELLVKGPQVMEGYYKDKKKTEEVLQNGWFRTGDIVNIDKEKFIKIIDRKKEIIVLSTGKNVAPQFVENHLNLNRYIQQSMVYGDNEKVLKAIIVPDFDQLKEISIYNFEEDSDYEEINNITDLRTFFRKEIDKSLNNLGKHEQIGEFKISHRQFLQDKNELTPTLKLKRKHIKKNFDL